MAAGCLTRTAFAENPAGLAWPGEARQDLVLPESLLAATARWEPVLGYPAEQMAHFGRDRHRLRTVENLFRHAGLTATNSGRIAEELVRAAHDPVEVCRIAYGLADVSAGRMLPLEDSLSWGVDWLPGRPDSFPPESVARALLDTLREDGDPSVESVEPVRSGARPADEAAIADFVVLPPPVQRLIVRVCLGAWEADPWLDAAVRRSRRLVISGSAAEGLASPLSPMNRGIGQSADTPGEALEPDGASLIYTMLAAPWMEERLGQLATLGWAAFEALQTTDRDYLAFGSAILLSHLRRGVAEFQASRQGADAGSLPAARLASLPILELPTRFGAVRVYGAGADSLREPAFLTIDLGGDDVYIGRHGANAGLTPPTRRMGICIDLGGNDRYDASGQPVSLGAGLLGVGVLWDLAGDDRYIAANAAMGAGIHGTGILLDQAGNDSYDLQGSRGQGSGLAGAGVLADVAGDDSYTCAWGAQGYGETLGAGALVDRAGDDRYLARDDGNISALYLGQSVSMAQGVGNGRRADLGDGHSMAGGFGVLADGAGDDSYHASAWSQGAGYWWSAGFLEDLGGNDRYRNGKYSLGAAAHFAVGCQVDNTGDDLYNIGHSGAVNQYQGHARDGSIGISVDGAGDDRYLLRSHCGGSGDLNSVGLFWDRAGRDEYLLLYKAPDKPDGWQDTPPLGSSTLYTPFHSFRDEMASQGIFLDSGGADVYRWDFSLGAGAESEGGSGPRAGQGALPGATATPAPVDAGDGLIWSTVRGPRSRGIGIDQAWYVRP